MRSSPVQSAPLPEREVSSCLGSYVVDLLDPNGKKLPEREVGILQNGIGT